MTPLQRDRSARRPPTLTTYARLTLAARVEETFLQARKRRAHAQDDDARTLLRLERMDAARALAVRARTRAVAARAQSPRS